MSKLLDFSTIHENSCNFFLIRNSNPNQRVFVLKLITNWVIYFDFSNTNEFLKVKRKVQSSFIEAERKSKNLFRLKESNQKSKNERPSTIYSPTPPCPVSKASMSESWKIQNVACLQSKKYYRDWNSSRDNYYFSWYTYFVIYRKFPWPSWRKFSKILQKTILCLEKRKKTGALTIYILRKRVVRGETRGESVTEKASRLNWSYDFIVWWRDEWDRWRNGKKRDSIFLTWFPIPWKNRFLLFFVLFLIVEKWPTVGGSRGGNVNYTKFRKDVRFCAQKKWLLEQPVRRRSNRWTS